MHKRAITALATAALGFWLAGPAPAAEKFDASLRFALGFPQGEFRDSLDRTGLGMDMSFAYLWPGTSVSTGVSFGFLIMGSESRDEPLSPTIPDLVVRVTTTNAILLSHAFIRLQPRSGAVRPYVEGLAGLHYLFTTTSLRGGDDGGEALSSTNFDDLAFSYGLGGGAKLALLRIERRERPDRIMTLDLDVGLRWLRGGQADYLKKGSVHRENGVVTYDVSTSRTDLCQAGVGLSFSF
jgi:hypothetical protein